MDKNPPAGSARRSSQSRQSDDTNKAPKFASLSSFAAHPRALSQPLDKKLQDRYAAVFQHMNMSGSAADLAKLTAQLNREGGIAELEFMELQVKFSQQKESLPDRTKLVLDYAAKATPNQKLAVEYISRDLAHAYLDSAVRMAPDQKHHTADPVNAFRNSLQESTTVFMKATTKRFAPANQAQQPFQWLMTGVARAMTNPSISDAAIATRLVNPTSGALHFIVMLRPVAEASTTLLSTALEALATAIPALPSSNSSSPEVTNVAQLRSELRQTVKNKLEGLAGSVDNTPVVAAALRNALPLFEPPSSGKSSAKTQPHNKPGVPVEQLLTDELSDDDGDGYGYRETKSRVPPNRRSVGQHTPDAPQPRSILERPSDWKSSGTDFAGLHTGGFLSNSNSSSLHSQYSPLDSPFGLNTPQTGIQLSESQFRGGASSIETKAGTGSPTLSAVPPLELPKNPLSAGNASSDRQVPGKQSDVAGDPAIETKPKRARSMSVGSQESTGGATPLLGSPLGPLPASGKRVRRDSNPLPTPSKLDQKGTLFAPISAPVRTTTQSHSAVDSSALTATDFIVNSEATDLGVPTEADFLTKMPRRPH